MTQLYRGIEGEDGRLPESPCGEPQEACHDAQRSDEGMKPETMSRDERSCLLYLETCAVDAGGLAEGVRMNADDLAAIDHFRTLGLIDMARLPARLLGHPNGRNATHCVRLTDAGWRLAHALRRLRALNQGPLAKEAFAELIERERLQDAPLDGSQVSEQAA